MDLVPLTQRPTDAERGAVEAALSSLPPGPPTGWEETRSRRTFLLPALLALQSRVGWVSSGGLGYACARLGVPPAEGWGVASFYALLALGERPPAFAHVCDDIACRGAGAERLCTDLSRTLGPPLSAPHRAEPGKPLPPTAARWARSPCLGLCDQAPAALVTISGDAPSEVAFGGASVERISAALAGELMPGSGACALGSLGPRRLLARAGKVDPRSLDAYRAAGGYQALRRAFDLGPEGIIREVAESKLSGRGGAAFPTGKKWEAVARASARPHFVVCNADESEPGTFKDRVLLELDPFAVVEAMTVAGLATGAERGYLYVRGEYPLAKSRLAQAISAARSRGLLGRNVMGRSFSFDVELRSGAGAYICGEETALFNSIEGLRGEPRSKPPFPVQVGLFGRPTAINNVETLVAALDVVRDGAAAWTSVGTAHSPGTKLFCVSGKVRAPGVYEVPFGTPLTTLLELAGGPLGTVQAVLLGGAAGTFLTPAQLSIPLSPEGAKTVNASLGSGVVLVLNDSDALAPLLRRIAAFFRDESCGQCVPCRVGTVRQEELLARLSSPKGDLNGERALLKELGQALRDASICGLGQAASSAVESAFDLAFPGPTRGDAR